MTAKIRRFLGWFFIGLLAFWIAMNFHSVQIYFFFRIVHIQLPASLLIFLSAALGAGSVYLLRFIRDYRKDKPPAP